MSSMITSTNLKLEKPLLDDRIFEQFTLPNGILVTTVSDTRSEKSSCSLAVRVGASSDSLPGLAHITEHAVFLGSQKYPVENEYKKFLNKNGGGSNGGTSMEQTVYKFYVNAPEFDGALDIFSQFFKSPLFETQAITREINAVDAEDAKNRILENRRFLQVLKHQILPNSDYSKFSTGNLRTLAFNELTTYGEGLSQKIRDFHQKYYRPREMAVSLVGPQTSEQLKQLAHNHFADISSFDLTSSEVLNSLDTLQTTPKEEQSSVFKNSRHQVIRIKPIRDLRDLSIIWQFPYSKFKYKENPSHLLSFLLNYKGEGSLFAYLQDQRYATSLSANIRTHFPEFTLFEVSLSLTKEGLNDYEKIVSAVYDYLELISTHLNKDGTFLKEGDDDQLTRLWEEMKAIRKINFLFEEKASPYETSPELAESMLEYPLHEIMSAGRLLNDFPRKDFQIYLEKMLNDPSYVILRSKDFDHLPNDEIYKIDEFMKKFEELQNKDELEKWKREGNYFERFRVWMDTWQKNEQHQKETEKSSFIEYEPYYGVPYEVNSFNLSELRSRARVTHEKTFQLPAINPFISYDLLEYDKILAERKQVCSETDVNHQPNSENIQEKEMDWNVNSAKLGIHQNGETQVKPLQSSPPKLLARFHKDTSTVEKFDVLQETDPSSSMIRNALWFSKDEIYETPKSTVFFLFKTPASDEVHPVSSLITSIFDQMMIRKYYPSSVAGLSHGFSLGQQGLGLRYVGFSNKLAKLAEVVTDDVLNLQTIWEKVDPQLFQDIKEKQFRALQSWFKDRPDSQANTILSYLVFQNSLLPMDKIDLLNQTDLPFLQERMRSIVKSIHNHIAYVHGDLNPSDAYEFYESVVKKVYEKQQHVSSQGGGNSPKDSYVEEQEKIRQLPSTIHHRVILPPFNEEDPNNAYILYFQTEKRSPQVLAKLLVLRKLLAEPAFNILRTKKQLGYIVSLSSADFGRGLRSVGGIELKILSKRFSPIAMEKEVESFLQDQYQHLLNSVTEVEIKNLKQSIITTIKDPMTSLIEEGYHYYSQIINEFPFDWKDQIIDVLQKEGEEGDNQGIHLKDIQQFYEEYVFSPNNACEEKKKSLAIMIFSQEQILEYNELKSNKLADNSVGNFLQRNCHDFMNLEETKTFRDSLDFY